jgi:anti-sigma factor RsiW
MDEKGQRGDLQSCFSPEELAAFVAGKLPKEEFDSIAAHIQRCPVCASLVEAAKGGAFPPALGGSRAEDLFDEEPEAEEMAQSVSHFFPPVTWLPSFEPSMARPHLSYSICSDGFPHVELG